MKKLVIRPGRVKEYNDRWANVYCKIEFTDGKLSISGVVGPHTSGNCVGSCGQIDMGFWHKNPKHNDKRYTNLVKPCDIDFADGWSESMWLNFLEYWKLYHLNDMQPACEHQRQLWDMKKEVKVIKYGWSDKFFKMRKK